MGDAAVSSRVEEELDKQIAGISHSTGAMQDIHQAESMP